jgi:hypothetical protein
MGTVDPPVASPLPARGERSDRTGDAKHRQCDPGEGALQRTEPIDGLKRGETPPHPDPLPASGARESAAFAELLGMNSDNDD